MTTRLFPRFVKSDPDTANVCASPGFGSVTVITPIAELAGEFSATVALDSSMFVGEALGSATVPEIVINPVFSPPLFLATTFTVRGKPSARSLTSMVACAVVPGELSVCTSVDATPPVTAFSRKN